MGGDRLGMLQRTASLQVGGDPGGAEGVSASPIGKAGEKDRGEDQEKQLEPSHHVCRLTVHPAFHLGSRVTRSVAMRPSEDRHKIRGVQTRSSTGSLLPSGLDQIPTYASPKQPLPPAGWCPDRDSGGDRLPIGR